MRSRSAWLVVGAGVVAGFLSGLFGVGGGIVMVPMLVVAMKLDQHAAHATSLAAIIPIAAAGATTFAIAGEVDIEAAVFLAVGSIAGAPLGAHIMTRSSQRALKGAFGVLALVVGGLLVFG